MDLSGADRPVFGWQNRPVPWDFDDADEYYKAVNRHMEEHFYD